MLAMLFSLVLISNLLFVPTVLAVPGRRREYQHTAFFDRVVQSFGADEVTTYSNWAGAVLEKGDGTFDYITATFAVPAAEGPDNSGGSVWIGLDGDTCTNSLFRAGVDFVVKKNVTSYEAWYQWYADEHHFISDLGISTGDKINVTVHAQSSKTGTVTITNLANHRSTSQNASSFLALCGQNAEWIVELFGSDDNLASFASFTPVTITDAIAGGSHGAYAPQEAKVLNIVHDSHTLTNVSVSESALTIRRA